MPLWLSPLWLVLLKNYAIWYFCLFSSLRKKQIGEAVSKVVNVMEILYFHENFFSFYKKVSSHLDLVNVMEILYCKCDGDFIFSWKLFSFYEKVSSHLDLARFFWNIFPQPPVWYFQLIFIIHYTVRKNIFARLFSTHNTKSLHVMNNYV